MALGHCTRLIPAWYVRPCSNGEKNDFCEAEAIAETARRPTMKFVAVKTVEQLALQGLHRRTAGHTRHVLMSSRTAPSKRASHKAGRCQFRRLPTPSLQFSPWLLEPTASLQRTGPVVGTWRGLLGFARIHVRDIHETPRFQPSPCHSNSICNAQLVDAEDGVRQLERAGGATELTAQVPFYVFCLADHTTLVSVPSGTHRMGYPGHLLFEPAVGSGCAS